VFLELFASLGQADAACSGLTYDIHLNMDEVGPRVGEEAHLSLEVRYD